MRNYSITNLEQSKRLFYAGLKLRTADYIVDSTFEKVDGVMNVREKPIRIEGASDLKKAETSKYHSAAWSLGKLIHMMPDMIPSAYDESGNEIADGEPIDFELVIGHNSIRYVSEDGVCRFQYSGSTLLDAAVDMMERLLKDSYYVYDDDGEDEWYNELDMQRDYF